MNLENSEIVDKLVDVGRLPASDRVDKDYLESFQALLREIDGDLDKSDSIRILQLLGPDDCFGLAWSIVHIAENCSEWPFFSEMSGVDPGWVRILEERSGL